MIKATLTIHLGTSDKSVPAIMHDIRQLIDAHLRSKGFDHNTFYIEPTKVEFPKSK